MIERKRRETIGVCLEINFFVCLEIREKRIHFHSFTMPRRKKGWIEKKKEKKAFPTLKDEWEEDYLAYEDSEEDEWAFGPHGIYGDLGVSSRAEFLALIHEKKDDIERFEDEEALSKLPLRIREFYRDHTDMIVVFEIDGSYSTCNRCSRKAKCVAVVMTDVPNNRFRILETRGHYNSWYTPSKSFRGGPHLHPEDIRCDSTGRRSQEQRLCAFHGHDDNIRACFPNFNRGGSLEHILKSPRTVYS